jgi:Family of unknown function (DUF6311)/Interleukin-like EMT inducer
VRHCLDWSSWSPGALLRLGFAATIGFGFFLYSFGYKLLATSNIGWLLGRADPATYYLGWQFYRNEPWSFPLGHFTGYMAPLGSSIGQTDSIPLVALLLKPFSGLLPETFQYFGAWVAINYVLMSAFAYLLLRRYCRNELVLWLGVLLLLSNPVLLWRQGGHIALASHWLLLAALWLYVRSAGHAQLRRCLGEWSALLTLSALIHPYLTAMVSGLAVVGISRVPSIHGRRPWLLVPLSAILFASNVILVWCLIGTIDPGGPPLGPAGGFGKFSLNLNAFFNPGPTSLITPPLAQVGRAQHEGFLYLGVGIMAAGVTALVFLLKSLPPRTFWRRHLALMVLTIGYLAFAISPRVTMGDHVLLSYSIPGFLEGVTGAFRSSGRFGWLAFYLLIIATVVMLARRAPARIAIPVLLMAATLQIYEFSGQARYRRALASMEYETPLKSPLWEHSRASFDRITTVPPYLYSTRRRADFAPLAYRALLNGQTIGTGYVARISDRARAERRSHLKQVILDGTPDPRSLYVFRDQEFFAYAPYMGDRFRCTELDGYPVCFTADAQLELTYEFDMRATELSTFLEDLTEFIVIVAVKDEATISLTDEQLAAFRGLGMNLDTLAYRGSYAGISLRGNAIATRIADGDPVELRLARGEAYGDLRLKHDMILRSAGYTAGNSASILIDGTEHSRNVRGVNICVLDEEQRLVWIGCFDTHVGGPGFVFRPSPRDE